MFTEATEDTVPDPDSEDDIEYGTGIYSIKMKIERDLPQFMPMYGKRVRIYYRGIVKRCTNCFDPHQRKFCKSEKVPWAEYVRGFAKHFPEIPMELYGKWAKMIDAPSQTQNQERGNSSEETQKVGAEPGKEEVEKQTKSQDLLGQKKNGKKNPKPSTQGNSSDLDRLAVGGEEDEDEEETTDEDDLLNLVKLLRASGVTTNTMKKSINQKVSGAKGKQGTKTRGRGRGRGKQ